MRRRVFQIAVVLSIVLCLTSAALWVRSYTLVHAFQLRQGTWPEKDIFRERVFIVTSSAGRIWIAIRVEDTRHDPRLRASNTAVGFHAIYATQPVIPPRLKRPGSDRSFRINGAHEVTHTHDTRWGSILFPAWLLPIFFAILPGIAVARRLKHRRRIENNLCTNCGYDLRASSERCPECGSPIGAAESPQSLVRPVDAIADR